MNARRYFEFDGLRGLLALWVAAAHVVSWCGYGRLAGEEKATKIWEMFSGAGAAAEAFIILSGFAIATLLQREQVGYGRYMLRRGFRIYPVYIVCLGLSIWLAPVCGMLIKELAWSGNYYLGWQATAQAAQDAQPAGHIWAHVLMLHGVLPKQVIGGVSATYLAPAWSIGLEEQFYLVAPLILWLFRRSWGLVALLAIAVAGQVWQAPWSNPMNATLPYWLPLFLVGIGSSFIAKMYERDQKASFKMWVAVVGGALVLAVFLVKSLLPMFIWTIVFPISIGAWRSFAPRVGRWISSGLCHPAAQWLGNLSYSLYLLHWPLIIALLGFLHRYQPTMSQSNVLLFMLTVGMAVILLFSWVLHCVVEKPFMALGRHLVNRRATAKPLPMMPATP